MKKLAFFTSFVVLAKLSNYHRGRNNSRYVVGDCENRTAHSHNRHHELSLGEEGGMLTIHEVDPLTLNFLGLDKSLLLSERLSF